MSDMFFNEESAGLWGEDNTNFATPVSAGENFSASYQDEAYARSQFGSAELVGTGLFRSLRALKRETGDPSLDRFDSLLSDNILIEDYIAKTRGVDNTIAGQSAPGFMPEPDAVHKLLGREGSEGLDELVSLLVEHQTRVGGETNVSSFDEIYSKTQSEMVDAHLHGHSISQRPSGLGSDIAGFGGAMVGMLNPRTNPAFAVTAPLGATRVAGQGLIAFALKNASISGGSELVLQTLGGINENRALVGLPEITEKEKAASVGAAFVFGGALPVAITGAAAPAKIVAKPVIKASGHVLAAAGRGSQVAANVIGGNSYQTAVKNMKLGELGKSMFNQAARRRPEEAADFTVALNALNEGFGSRPGVTRADEIELAKAVNDASVSLMNPFSDTPIGNQLYALRMTEGADAAVARMEDYLDGLDPAPAKATPPGVSDGLAPATPARSAYYTDANIRTAAHQAEPEVMARFDDLENQRHKLFTMLDAENLAAKSSDTKVLLDDLNRQVDELKKSQSKKGLSESRKRKDAARMQGLQNRIADVKNLAETTSKDIADGNRLELYEVDHRLRELDDKLNNADLTPRLRKKYEASAVQYTKHREALEKQMDWADTPRTNSLREQLRVVESELQSLKPKADSAIGKVVKDTRAPKKKTPRVGTPPPPRFYSPSLRAEIQSADVMDLFKDGLSLRSRDAPDDFLSVKAAEDAKAAAAKKKKAEEKAKYREKKAEEKAAKEKAAIQAHGVTFPTKAGSVEVSAPGQTTSRVVDFDANAHPAEASLREVVDAMPEINSQASLRAETARDPEASSVYMGQVLGDVDLDATIHLQDNPDSKRTQTTLREMLSDDVDDRVMAAMAECKVNF